MPHQMQITRNVPFLFCLLLIIDPSLSDSLILISKVNSTSYVHVALKLSGGYESNASFESEMLDAVQVTAS